MTIAATTHLDAQTEAYVADVLERLAGIVELRAAYLVGSGAAGGFDRERSDVDLVAVAAHALTEEHRRAIVEQVGSLPSPARELELVVYVDGAQPPDYALNLDGGVERPDEAPHWFVLDAALAEEHAVPLLGPPWAEVFAPIPAERVRAAAAESLAWSERQPADDEFARVNALRARHYLTHGEFVSKRTVTR